MCHLVGDTELIVGTVPAAAHKLDNKRSDKLPKARYMSCEVQGEVLEEGEKEGASEDLHIELEKRSRAKCQGWKALESY